VYILLVMSSMLITRIRMNYESQKYIELWVFCDFHHCDVEHVRWSIFHAWWLPTVGHCWKNSSLVCLVRTFHLR